MKWFLIIQPTDESKRRDPQPNIRQNSRNFTEERKDCRAQRGQDNTRKPTEPTNVGSKGLTDTELTTREPMRV